MTNSFLVFLIGVEAISPFEVSGFLTTMLWIRDVEVEVVVEVEEKNSSVSI